MSKIVCPKCKAEQTLNEYELLEAALLICPNCGAEFSLTATLEKLPDEEGDAEEPIAPELPTEPVAPPEPAELPAAPSEEPFPPDSESVKREPMIRAQVLTCSVCHAEWVDTHRNKCPNCQSDKVLASAKSIEQRAQGALEEVDRGVPAARAVSKLLGRYEKEE